MRVRTATASRSRAPAVAALLALLAAAAPGAERPAVGVVSHVKVLSDKVADVSSFAAWKRSYIRDGMSDEEKALAIWTSIVAHQHQDAPPYEYLQHEDFVLDPIKIFNVYGYSLCGVAASDTQAFARYLGMRARGWTLTNHVVPEIFYGGAWHLVDPSMIDYYRKPDGSIAGAEDVRADVAAWYASHPGFFADEKKLREFMRGGNWRKNGPPIVATAPWLSDNGWSASNCHGWYDTMIEYDGKTFDPYELGCSQGYQVDIQLRDGERLTRNWSNKGLALGDARPEALNPIDSHTLAYCRKFGDLANERIGNGTLSYVLPLASGAFRGGMLLVDNLAATADDHRAPAVHVRDAAKPGTLVFRMPSSYVYLGGELALTSVIGDGGSIAVSFSQDNGLDWKPVAALTESGARTIDLKPLVYARYDYQLRFQLVGAGTGLDAIAITHDIQHSQRPLPALDRGDNTISFSAGPQEGTVTIEGSTSAKNAGKQLLITDFHPLLRGVELSDGLNLTGADGDVTFPISAPGDIVRLRFGCHYRARDADEGFDLQVSFDGGKTFATVGRAGGPGSRLDAWITDADVPARTRTAVVRYHGRQKVAASLFNVRIDADYVEPSGGFRPVRVIYRWQEDGVDKSDVHVATKPDETWTISCAAKPRMTSITLELAP